MSSGTPRYGESPDLAQREKTDDVSALEEANRILAGALAKARELNIKVSAAVCDSGGSSIALQRMDNAIWASVLRQPGQGGPPRRRSGRPSGEIAPRADQPTPRGIAAAVACDFITTIKSSGPVHRSRARNRAPSRNGDFIAWYRRQERAGPQDTSARKDRIRRVEAIRDYPPLAGGKPWAGGECESRLGR